MVQLTVEEHEDMLNFWIERIQECHGNSGMIVL